MKKIMLFCSFLFFGVPVIASAHVKWFIDAHEVTKNLHSQTPLYTWGSTEVLTWSIIVLCVVVFFGFLDAKVPTPTRLLKFGLAHERQIRRVAQTLLGLFLISVSFLWKIIIVPDFHIVGTMGLVLGALQVLVGLMYTVNWKPQIASAILFFLTIGITLSFGVGALLENALLVSLALYFFIIHAPKDSFISTRLEKHSVEIVRIGTGISLIVLAFTEKILFPELSLSFLDVHHWNFMQQLFPWFTNNLFVLSTGFAEMIFGILFIMGYLTRTTTVLIALFFALSVVTMLANFNMWEVEDLVVYAAAILFIFFGHGKTKFFHFIWPNSKLQRL